MRFCILIIILISGLFIHIFSVTVDGYVFLEGETDHSGIKIFLQRTAPDTNFNYTIYTDASGYYTSTVESGLYDIDYSKLTYEVVDTLSINLYSDNTLPNRTLAFTNSLWGNVSGVLSAGVYSVYETITVNYGDTLNIDPGVTLNFDETDHNITTTPN